MAVQMHEIEIWVKIDEDGDYDVGRDRDTAEGRYEESVTEGYQGGVRLVKITLQVPLPKPLEVSGEVVVSEECGELKAV